MFQTALQCCPGYQCKDSIGSLSWRPVLSFLHPFTLQELEAISIEDYHLEEIGVFFLLSQKVPEVFLEVEMEPCEVKVPKVATHRRANSYGGLSVLPLPLRGDLKKSRSIQSSAIDLAEGSRSRLRHSFWLVLHVLNQGTSQYVQLYFQRRCVFVCADGICRDSNVC